MRKKRMKNIYNTVRNGTVTVWWTGTGTWLLLSSPRFLLIIVRESWRGPPSRRFEKKWGGYSSSIWWPHCRENVDSSCTPRSTEWKRLFFSFGWQSDLFGHRLFFLGRTRTTYRGGTEKSWPAARALHRHLILGRTSPISPLPFKYLFIYFYQVPFYFIFLFSYFGFFVDAQKTFLADALRFLCWKKKETFLVRATYFIHSVYCLPIVFHLLLSS